MSNKKRKTLNSKDKENKNIKEIVIKSERKVYLKEDDFTIIKDGVKNKYDEALTKYLSTLSKLKKLKLS